MERARSSPDATLRTRTSSSTRSIQSLPRPPAKTDTPVPRHTEQMISHSRPLSGARHTALPNTNPFIQRFIRLAGLTRLSSSPSTIGIAVKIGLVARREVCSYGIRHGRDKAPGCRAAACARVAWELPPRSEGPSPLRDAKGDHKGVHARRCPRSRRTARLLPDPCYLSFHTVLRCYPRRLLERKPAVRRGALRLPEAAPAGAGLRPDPDLHREHAPQRRHGARPPIRRNPWYHLGRFRSLRGPYERPQPRLRRAGDAAVLEGQGHRHPYDAGPLGPHTDRSTAPGSRPVHR